MQKTCMTCGKEIRRGEKYISFVRHVEHVGRFGAVTVDYAEDQATHHTGCVPSAPAGLPRLAAHIATRLREHFPAETEQHRQVLNLAEETGEFVGAYRRWVGLARRTGTWEDVTAELADVVITAYITAHVLGIDLDAAWHAKAQTILTRGWREPAATT